MKKKIFHIRVFVLAVLFGIRILSGRPVLAAEPPLRENPSGVQTREQGISDSEGEETFDFDIGFEETSTGEEDFEIVEEG